ncbi:MAG: hypothetical protein AAFN07_10855 [Pseudomonadota bacterium]
MLGNVAVAWGTLAFVGLLTYGVANMVPLILESLEYPWSAGHYALFLANLIVMAWYEGYKGFQRGFSPRFAARAVALRSHASPINTVAAPLVLMGFMNAPFRRVMATIILTTGIVAIVMVYRLLPQPWRGILDSGVVVGLGWGAIATISAVVSAIRRGPTVHAEWH